jgi:hypothetical protein
MRELVQKLESWQFMNEERSYDLIWDRWDVSDGTVRQLTPNVATSKAVEEILHGQSTIFIVGFLDTDS